MSDVLDRNLAALLTRAYEKVEPRAAFRERLRRDFLAHAAELAVRPRRFELARSRPLLVALAASVAVIVAGWMAFRAGSANGAASRDELLARGEIAVRRARDGSWRAAERPEIEFRDGYLAVATPRERGAEIAVGAARAEWDLARDSELEVEGRRGVGARLARGSLVARRDGVAGGAWRISTGHGDVELVGGEVRIDRERERAHVRVANGEALAGRSRTPLAGGAEAWLAYGDVLGREPFGAGTTPSRAGVEASGAASVPPREPSAGPGLRGRVIGPDGEPLDDFRVLLLRSLTLPHVGEPLVHEFARAGGAFEIATVARGRYRVEVQASGLAPWRATGVELGGAPVEVEASLAAGAMLRGFVIDAATQLPIEGACVVAEADAPVQVLALDLELIPACVPFALTSADGSFALANASPGAHVLRASAPGYGPAWIDVAEVDAGDTRGEIEIALGPCGAIEGSVLDAGQTPVADSIVLCTPTAFERNLPTLSYRFTRTGADGGFLLRDLSPGMWAVLHFRESNAGAGAGAPQMAFATIEAKRTARVDFHARGPRLGLEGTLRDAAGAPLAGHGVMVAPTEKAREPPQGSWSSTTTDAAGRFAIGDLEAGLHEVFVAGRTPVEIVRVAAVDLPLGPPGDLELALPAGAISGLVRDAARDAPVESAVLIVMRDGAGREPLFCGKVTTGADGRYEVPFLEPGDYSVIAYASDGSLGAETKDRIAVGDQPVGGVDFDLWPGASVEVRVVGADGAPVAGASIALADPRGRRLAYSQDPVTERDGRYVASGVKPGRWRVLATLEGREVASPDFDLAAGERRAVELTIPRRD